MYIGKFLLNSKDLKRPIEIPVFFRHPTLTEVNNILRKHNFPTMTIKEFQSLYLNRTEYYSFCVYLGNSLHYSIEFVEKGLRY